MGTVVTIDLFGARGIDPGAALGPVARAVEALHRADRVFSTWRDSSPISRLRRGEIGLGEAPPEVADVLDACRSARDLTEGWFDPWALPGGVDPTGLVKGWAAQRALDELRGAAIDGAMVNAAGDIACFGGPGPGRGFRVGVVRPDDRLGLAAVVDVAGAIATSGTYERGEHLVDPFTRARRAAAASATVTGPDLGLADALATALCAGGAEVLALLDGIDGYEGLTLGPEGARAATAGFPFATPVGASA